METLSPNKVLAGLRLEEDDFLKLLAEMISHGEKLVNSPPEFIAQESLVADIVCKYLSKYSGDDGPLEVRKIEYHEGRANVIIKFKPLDPVEGELKWVSIMGSHLDVVPADGATWKRDPFKLIREDDVLYGRGVSDCLGHVALLCNLFKQLAEQKPRLQVGVCAVFIANEEAASVQGIGVDKLSEEGELDFLTPGTPVYWLDVANTGPVLGSGGMLTWALKAKGKLFHSGFPTQAINPITMGQKCLEYVETCFYRDFPRSSQCDAYKYAYGSTLKPTQISCPPGSLSQIPGECEIKGDIRIVPFDDLQKIKDSIEQYVKEFNESLEEVGKATPGPSGFVLADQRGVVELEWLQEKPTEGVAVDLESHGHKAILQATNEVTGEAKPFSLTGTLPLIRDLQKQGLDVQLIGYGRLEGYHAKNEFGYLSEFRNGYSILMRTIDLLNQRLVN